MASECPHGAVPGGCHLCQPTPVAVERVPDSRPFATSYDGECAGCGFDVKAGETVRFANGGRFYHDRCTA